MAIDTRQFHQTFLEESLESLAKMEAELLQIEGSAAKKTTSESITVDKETLNTIFRVVHSIKGGGSTFGCIEVAKFAHVIETLLDDVREGRCAMDQDIIGVLLRSVDHMRKLIAAAESEPSTDKREGKKLTAEISKFHVSKRAPLEVGHAGQNAAAPPEATWHIRFRPYRGFFKTGNDPLRLIRELARLGSLKTQVDVSELPEWDQFDPEDCYLAWNLELKGNVCREAIDEIFAWVTDDCEVAITAKSASEVSSSHSRSEQASQGSDQMEGDRPSGERRTTSIRVNITKIDTLVNIVGELVITQTMLNEIANKYGHEGTPELQTGLSQLERNMRELQDSVMNIRMLPIGVLFNGLPRMVRDVSKQLCKNVTLKFSGERTELDNLVVEGIRDPLLHIVRNCIDHGIETPAQRKIAEKPETGLVQLDAYQRSGSVVIEIKDDGQGIQPEKVYATAVKRGLISPETELTTEEIRKLIFTPGFSTAETISSVSGRGVGMDVVRNNIRGVGGNVEVYSEPGEGTKFTIRLPLTLAIVDGLSVLVGMQLYILPLISIMESIRISSDQVYRPANGSELFVLRDEYLPLIRVYEFLQTSPRTTDVAQGIVVVVEADGQKAGLLVDELVGQKQVVIKSLQEHCDVVEGIAAATILGDGAVALILDVPALIRLAHVARSRTSDGGESTGALIKKPNNFSSGVDQALRS